MKDVDEKFHAYIIKQNKEYDYYLMNCEFILVFNIYHYCPQVTSELHNNRTMCFWYKFLANVINDFKDKGYNFNQIAKIKIITISNKLGMSYDFDNKHNMCALEIKRYDK